MENQQDLVSVIVPIYNMEKHLDRCLDSILRQTYRNLEVLLIDDGSTDSSLEIMNDYAKRDERVRVFHKENGGVSSARNLGLEMMKGEYCTFVDPDDYVADVYVEWLYASLVVSDADFAVCDHARVTTSDIELFQVEKYIYDTIIIKSSSWSFFVNGRNRTPCLVWAALYKKTILNNLRFDEDLYYGEDTLFFVRYILRSEKCVSIEVSLYFYVQHSESFSHGEYSPKKGTLIKALRRIVELTQSGPPELRHSAEAWYLINCASTLMDLMHSPYYNRHDVNYLVREIRRFSRAVVHIPNDRRSVRIRTLASVFFPRVTSYLLWYYFNCKDNERQRSNMGDV